jgi:hypothetical protein
MGWAGIYRIPPLNYRTPKKRLAREGLACSEGASGGILTPAPGESETANKEMFYCDHRLKRLLNGFNAIRSEERLARRFAS